MASSETLPGKTTPRLQPEHRDTVFSVMGEAARILLTPFASLKFTVALFGMAIFIVLAGTLAQVEKDIWQVIDEYFRTLFAFVEVRVFFPKSFFPTLSVPAHLSLPFGLSVPFGFYFPGGWLIGAMMAVNLLAAHSLRFTMQARGTRLMAGIAGIALGMLATWIVIVSGANKDGLQGAPLVEWATLWEMFKWGLLACVVGGVYALGRITGRAETSKLTFYAGGAATLLLAVLTAWLFYKGDDVRLGDSSMRILWQLIKGTFASGVLLAGCIAAFKKRAGIVLLHGGIALMMFSELFVGLTAIEAQMRIEEGETVNFVQDIRTVELAVIDRSDPGQDDVVVVPRSYLREGETIRHEYLPFDVEVVKYIQNSALRRVKPDDENPADQGVGKQWIAEPVRPGSGVDADGKVDVSSVYVRFLNKSGGEDLGVYLLSLQLAAQDIPETITVDGRPYDLFLRFKRTYKPYAMHLMEVRKDDYPGTTTPRNYSSDLRLIDESRGVDREVKIWMNNPLRYAGETFYQSNYEEDPQSGMKATTLSVVTNTGWMIPYVACMIVAAGMLYQFGLVLLRFLNRRTAPAEIVEFGNGRPDLEPRSNRKGHQPVQKKKKHGRRHAAGNEAESIANWLIPAGVVLLAALLVAWSAGKARTPVPIAGMNVHEFGKLPLLYQGRVKPFDTLARNSLVVLSGKQTFTALTYLDQDERSIAVEETQLDAQGKRVDGRGRPVTEVKSRQPAIRWLLDVIADADGVRHHRVFKIDNLELLAVFDLKPRKGYLYSHAELEGKWAQFEEQVRQARNVDAEYLSPYQRKVLELQKRIHTYMLLVESFRPPPLPAIPTEEEFRQDPEAARQKLEQLRRMLIERPRHLAEMHPPLAVPLQPDEDDSAEDEDVAGKHDWQPYSTAWIRAFVQTQVMGQDADPATVAMTKMLVSYSKGDAESFNREVAAYQKRLAADAPVEVNTAKTNFEAFFNGFAPFYQSSALYVLAFVLTALAWLGWNRPLNRAAFYLMLFTLLVHSFALLARMYISGRPPVTNLYSSAVFIGWGTVVLGLVLEAVYRMGVGNVIASTSGFATLLIAHYLAGDGDTFVVLQAVLDTQFWLATHVVIITLGYATTFVAGLLGLIYILRGVLTPSLSPGVGKDLSRMIYGSVCFAIFFSFVGTVLGGLWADDSWGRFWGWDPKENGALIIVLWNALILHARWDGMVKERGMAALAVGGNIATAWSWFGVNELGVGLHSYGFTEGVLLALGLFVISQLAVIGLALLPKHHWWSAKRYRD